MVTVFCTAKELLQHEENASPAGQSNIVDLGKYRRQRERIVCTEPEDVREQRAEEPAVLQMPGTVAAEALPERKRRQDRRAWLLDIWASLGVVVMTAAFTLRVILS